MGLRKGGIVSGTLMLCVMAGAWFFLAPPVIGGSTTYTITTGNSMEPLLHDGDLAVVREASAYEIGDAAAYKSRQLGHTALHRIVGREGDGYIFKGDNNDFLDPEQPEHDQLIGKLWFHVPKLGNAFTALRSPLGIGTAALVVVVLTSGMFATTRRRKNRARHRARRNGNKPATVQLPDTDASEPVPPTTLRVPPKPPPPPPPRARAEQPPRSSSWASSNRARRARVVALVALALALVFAGGALYTRTQPQTLIGSQDAQYTHSGTFSYHAPVPDSPAYDGPELTTGEPIFLKVVDEVTVDYEYRFETDADHDVGLDGSLEARLSASNGLKRTIGLDSEVAEKPDGATLSAPLVVDEIQGLVRAVEKETGVDQSSYTVAVVAHVDVGGTIAGQPVVDTFSSDIDLRLDGLQLSAPLTTEGTIAKGTFTSSETAAVEQEEERPNDVVVADRRLGIATLERAAWIGAAAALLALIAALLFLFFLSPRDEANRIHARYGTLIVPIEEAPHAEVDTVDVPDIDTLARLAEQFEQVILHEVSHNRHTYIVSHDGFLYRYRVAAQARSKAVAR